MGFIKRGEGKIVSIIEEDDLTDAQKKAAEDLSGKTVKSNNTDISIIKKSNKLVGNNVR
jgi:hypothetical protein